MSLRGRFRSMTVCGKMMRYGASIVISVSIVSALIRFSLHAAIGGGEIMECDTRRSGRGDRRESSGAEVLACGEQCEGHGAFESGRCSSGGISSKASAGKKQHPDRLTYRTLVYVLRQTFNNTCSQELDDRV